MSHAGHARIPHPGMRHKGSHTAALVRSDPCAGRTTTLLRAIRTRSCPGNPRQILTQKNHPPPRLASIHHHGTMIGKMPHGWIRSARLSSTCAPNRRHVQLNQRAGTLIRSSCRRSNHCCTKPLRGRRESFRVVSICMCRAMIKTQANEVQGRRRNGMEADDTGHLRAAF